MVIDLQVSRDSYEDFAPVASPHMERSEGTGLELQHWDFSLLEPVPPNLLAPVSAAAVEKQATEPTPVVLQRLASNEPNPLPSPLLQPLDSPDSLLQFDLDASDVESSEVTPFLGPAKTPTKTSVANTPKFETLVLPPSSTYAGEKYSKKVAVCGLHRCTSEAAHEAALQRRHSIEQDLVRMFPLDPFFQPQSPFLALLRQLVEAVCNFLSSAGKSPYMQGLSYLCAGFLLHMDAEDAFVCMVNLLERVFFQSVLAMNADHIALRFQAFSLVLALNFPLLHAHFEKLHLPPDCYLLDWLVTLFSRALPHHLTACVWDRILLHDELHTLKIAAALVQILQHRLLCSDAMVCQRLLRAPIQESLDTQIQQDELLEAIDSIQLPEQLSLKNGQLTISGSSSSRNTNARQA
jgi:hypothetical protein